jgi:hypothetical protein
MPYSFNLLLDNQLVPPLRGSLDFAVPTRADVPPLSLRHSGPGYFTIATLWLRT